MRVPRIMRLVAFSLALAAIAVLAGCSWLGDLLVKEELEPLVATLWYMDTRYERVVQHPQDSLGGLPVRVDVSEPCFINWGDGSATYWSESLSTSHTYTSEGKFAINCWLEGQQPVTFEVVATNTRPVIGEDLLTEPKLHWRDDYLVLLSPHVAGCNGATGEYTYDMGVIDPDGDETRKRFTVTLIREVLVGEPDEGEDLPDGYSVGDLLRYDTVQEFSVFSLHDRENVTGNWADVWGVWFRIGWSGQVPPWPFGTWTYESLAPDYVDAPDPFPTAALSPKEWPQPDWPDPGECPDCGGDEPNEPPDPYVPETEGDCFIKIVLQAVDRWGGYYGLAWKYPISCEDNWCCPPCPSGGSGGCGCQ